jgi:hypothetical protein
MILPIHLVIPNYHAPTFRNRPRDLRVSVGSSLTLRFSDMKDDDKEDFVYLYSIDFYNQPDFISGNFPKYDITPRDNKSNPGVYPVRVNISDNNPNPRYTIYSFKIFVEP